jgi:N-acyl-D-aspartate/D-glutamate deacylase
LNSSGFAVHPRGYGAFPRVLARYVRDLGVLSLEAAVHRMTTVAANEIMAYDRGRLAPGLAADVVIFDPATVRDRATFAEPTLAPEGIEIVLVNGELVFEGGKYTGARPGRVIRGPGYRR